jgi:hypothetical protein
MMKLKKKIGFTKGFKTKITIKRMRIKLERKKKDDRRHTVVNQPHVSPFMENHVVTHLTLPWMIGLGHQRRSHALSRPP